MLSNKTSAAGHAAALFTVIVWGTTFISTKVLLRAFSPLEILFLRFVLGFVMLCIINPKPFRTKSKKEEAMMALAGLTGICLYYLLENVALTYTQASNISVIVSIAPIFTGILAHFFLDGEKLKGSFIVGFFCAIAGIGLISFGGSGGVAFNPAGDLMAVAAAMIWGVYSILSRKIGSLGYDVIQTTRRTFFYGIACMIPALFFMDFHPSLGELRSGVNLFNMVYLGLGASAMCFVTWNISVRILGAVKTSIYIYMVPVITIIISIPVLGEVITPWTAAGTFLTLAGLFISEGRLARLWAGRPDPAAGPGRNLNSPEE
ncbi:DMT family transporter [Enterocloster citroniae]|uniref:Drug/metabolite transporter (DMT)-like permease n=2 Tax=Enterocloster citroniae TaxID=358743 RepID=A0ABV2FY17_9FIRM|nr:DMT family transporter [Enterocloster citroniae]KMW16046.1 hypothetical protein HMPREF9470_04484 [[Clostridium] citroniae WAL-19142]